MTQSHELPTEQTLPPRIRTKLVSLSLQQQQQNVAEIVELPAAVKPVAADHQLQASSVVTFRALTAEYNIEARSREFLRQYPGLRGQFNLELVQCTPYLMADEKLAVHADYAAVFRAFNWPEFPYTSRLDQLVPESRTPFKDCVTFCWYAYSPYSRQGSRMRTIYQNVMFRESATWFMTNKQAMLRRLLLFEASRKVAIGAGLASVGPCGNVACGSFIPPTLVHSRGREAATASCLTSGRMYIVKPANGLQGRGIEFYRHGGCAKEFAQFMTAHYDESSLQAGFHVVQLYIDRPLLIRARKFDLRVYLLIVPNMSCSLGCDSNQGRRGFFAFYHPGFARLSCLEYGDGSSSERRVHLTNCCVQEVAPDCKPEETNWTPDQVNEYFNLRFEAGLDGIPCRDWFRLTAQADLQAILAYVVTEFSRLLTSDPYNSFKLLGCDFLIDSNLRPWLLEMNSMPSLRIRSPCHQAIKSAMQREALALAVEVAHRSANGLPVTSRCLAMRQNFRLIYSATNPKVQGGLVAGFSERLRRVYETQQ